MVNGETEAKTRAHLTPEPMFQPPPLSNKSKGTILPGTSAFSRRTNNIQKKIIFKTQSHAIIVGTRKYQHPPT